MQTMLTYIQGGDAFGCSAFLLNKVSGNASLQSRDDGSRARLPVLMQNEMIRAIDIHPYFRCTEEQNSICGDHRDASADISIPARGSSATSRCLHLELAILANIAAVLQASLMDPLFFPSCRATALLSVGAKQGPTTGFTAVMPWGWRRGSGVSRHIQLKHRNLSNARFQMQARRLRRTTLIVYMLEQR